MKSITIIASLLLPLVARAWVVSPRIVTSTRLTAKANDEPASSRRQWLVTTATAVAGALVGGKPVLAAGTSTATSPARVVSSSHTCDASVTVWEQPETGRRVYLLGTAHISSTSAELAGEVIDDVRPDAVFVELDAKRVKMTAPSAQPSGRPTTTSASSQEERGIALSSKPIEALQGPETPTPAPIKSSSGMSKQAVAMGGAVVGSAIKGMYSNLGDAGFKPGEEFVIAVREGQKVGAKVILGDRDVEVTLRRLSEALRQTNVMALLSPDSEFENSMKALMPNDLPVDSKDDKFKSEMTAYVEVMKGKENVRAIMGQLQRVAPEIYQAMVAERDAYMANGLDKLNMFPVIVAVMGIAHVDGVENYLKNKGWTPVKLTCKPDLKE